MSKRSFTPGALIFLWGIALALLACLMVLYVELFGHGLDRLIRSFAEQAPEYEPAKVIIINAR